MSRSTVIAGLRDALVTIAAVLLSFGATYALCVRYGAPASAAVLAAALCVGLMRRRERLGDLRALAIKFLALPLVALAAGTVGFALLIAPVLGAVLFSGGIALSIWLRNFGERAAAIGRTIALPFLAILIVPVHVDANGNALLAALLVIAAGAIAFACSTIGSWALLRLGAAPEALQRKTPRAQREGAMPIATRMALQMLAALAIAFTIGLLLFPAHWAWVVLTAFIVCSGAVGRGDAIYKALLRLAGAVSGTFAAVLIAQIPLSNPSSYAAAVFFVLFIGIWLRQINYAYWAACATLIFALLQGAHGNAALALFGARVLGIVAGALCAVAATWFVYPIRTGQLVRRRVADALGTLRDVLTARPDDAQHDGRIAELGRHAADLERVAPPVRLHRTFFRHSGGEAHPATLIERTHALVTRVCTPGFDRQAAGAELRRIAEILRSQRPT